MGALILMLLVVTRQVRKQVIAEAVPASSSSLQFEPPPLLVISEQGDNVVATLPEIPTAATTALEPGVFVIDPEGQSQASHAPDKPSGAIGRVPPIATRKLPKRVIPPTVHPDQTKVDLQWSDKVRRLEEKLEEERQRVATAQAAVKQKQQEITEVEQRSGGSAMLTEQAQSDKQAVQRRLRQLTAERESLSDALKSTEKALQGAINKQREEKGKRFRIIPVDPVSGTRRRPIIIDCRDDHVAFASEGIRLTPRELDGFTAKYNPLAAGVLALSSYRAQHRDPSADNAYDSDEPYVLLIVPPEGTISYYVARLMLQSHGIPYGYELISADQSFAWDPSTEAEKKVCQQAVEAVLKRPPPPRRSATADGPNDPISVVGKNGRFYLDEVERLRNQGGDNYGGIDRGGPPSAPPSGNYRGFDPDKFGDNEIGHSGEDDHYTGGRALLPDHDATQAGRGKAFVPAPQIASQARPQTRSVRPRFWNTDGTESRSDLQQRREDHRSNSRNPSRHSSSEQGAFNNGNDLRRGTTNSSTQHGDTREGQPGTPSQGQPSTTSRNSESQQSGSNNQVGPDGERRWGIAAPDASIGIAKHVTVRIEPGTLRVGDEDPVALSAKGIHEVRNQIASALDHHIRTLGSAPDGFYWKPRVEFIVTPAAAGYYGPASALMNEWGVGHSVKYVLE